MSRNLLIVLAIVALVAAPAAEGLGATAPGAQKPATLVPAPTLPATAPGQRPLVRVKSKRLAVVYMVRHANLRPYSSVLVERIGIQYRAGNAGMYKLDKGNLAKLHANSVAAFEKRLAADGRYELVSRRRAGTLVLRANLKDVWLAFSEADAAGRTKATGEYAIQMTLDAQLIDGETGEVLVAASDRKGSRIHQGNGRLTGQDAWREIDKALDFWAFSLREALDDARK